MDISAAYNEQAKCAIKLKIEKAETHKHFPLRAILSLKWANCIVRPTKFQLLTHRHKSSVLTLPRFSSCAATDLGITEL